MALINRLIHTYFAKRLQEIECFTQNPIEVQSVQLKSLMRHLSETHFGRDHGLTPTTSFDQYRQKVPIRSYEELESYILRSKSGEQSVMWDSNIDWFAKSSGTTGSKSKFIPVTKSGLNSIHLQGPKDTLAIFSKLHPNSKAFSGKALTLGGSLKVEQIGNNIKSGDLSAILIENTPILANLKRLPSVETALISDFDKKVERIYAESKGENITSFAGVPSWNLVMMNKFLEFSGKDNILDIWPNMELFIHGGMSFKPYREQFKQIIPSSNMKYLETYNASEGFFSIADDPTRDDMLLMLDYKTFYEFLPMSSLSDLDSAVPLEGVKCGVSYAMIISSCNGLWRYMIGDTVEFTSTNPYRIKISGRIKHFINVFGEEIIVDNAEQALEHACHATEASVTDFTVAPIFMDGRNKGHHEWVVEFLTSPASEEEFIKTLDATLQSINSDYEAKRTNNTTLLEPKLTVVKSGCFMRWMESRGKVGGQNKVPRLFNDRTYVDQLLTLNAD